MDKMTASAAFNQYGDPHCPVARKNGMKTVSGVINGVAALALAMGALTAGFSGVAVATPVALLLAGLGKYATSDVVVQTKARSHAQQRAVVANAQPKRIVVPAERFMPGSAHSKRIA